MNKKAKKITTAGVQAAILVLVIVIVLFSIYAEMIPEAQAAGDSMNDSTICEAASCTYNASGSPSTCQVNTTNTTECANDYDYIPLASLFGGTGVVFVVIMAVLLIVVIAGLLKATKK